MVHNITMGEYRKIYEVMIELSQTLVRRRARGEHEQRLTPMLFKRFWRSAFRCQGFAYWMKDSVSWKCNIDHLMMDNGMTPWAANFYFWTVSPKPGTPNDMWLVGWTFCYA